MVLTPTAPRRPRLDLDTVLDTGPVLDAEPDLDAVPVLETVPDLADPVLDPGPVAAAPGSAPAVLDPRPRPPGTTAEPDGIITCYVRPRRRRRRRRLVVTAAVLAATTVWIGLIIWSVSSAAPRPPGI